MSYIPLTDMEWLNYHHLYYFWLVAREGSIARAAKRMRLTHPTISKQLSQLEVSFNDRLFERVGRTLVLTDFGQTVFQYADEIFSLGRELQEAVHRRTGGRTLSLRVGLVEVLPKLVAHRLLKPAFQLREPVHVICSEGKYEDLLADLTLHRLDIVLSDAPVGSTVNVRAFSHLLGECGVSLFGVASLASKYRRRFPRSLDGAPFLLPTETTAVRRALDQWFSEMDIQPTIIGEFEDTAILKVFGQDGVGLFPAPAVIEREVCRQYKVRLVGRIETVREQYYAISVERRLKHPAVLAIREAARGTLSV